MRKGMLFLPRNFVGLIVAVVGLAIIGGLIFKVVSVINSNNEIESARSTFEFIMAKIETIENDQNVSFIVQGFRGADNWYLTGWDSSYPAESKPEKCFFGSCVCLCPSSHLQSCQEKGFCKQLNQNMIAISTIYNSSNYIDSLRSTNYEYTNLKISCINLASNLIQIDVLKTDERVSLSLAKPYGSVDSFSNICRFESGQVVDENFVGGGV